MEIEKVGKRQEGETGRGKNLEKDIEMKGVVNKLINEFTEYRYLKVMKRRKYLKQMFGMTTKKGDGGVQRQLSKTGKEFLLMRGQSGDKKRNMGIEVKREY